MDNWHVKEFLKTHFNNQRAYKHDVKCRAANGEGKSWEKTMEEMWEFDSGGEQGSQDGGLGGGEDSSQWGILTE